tara:strand:+ start:740 stop:1018 length:279 start_codon:yes stop_codon:yes gene_type:complete
MPFFRKKPVVIEAVQWFPPDDAEPEWMTHELYKKVDFPVEGFGWVETLEGGHVVSPGGWIIRGVKGETYPCKPDIFEMTYDPLISGAGEKDE